MTSPLRDWLQRHILQPIRDAESESHQALTQRLADPERSAIDGRVLSVLLICALDLTLLQYLGLTNGWKHLAPLLELLGVDDARTVLRVFFKYDPEGELRTLLYWVASTVLFYLIIPALAVKLILKEPLRDFGLSTQGLLRHLPLYGALFALVLPVVLIAAQSSAFLKTYPFYSKAHRSTADLLIWEAGYALQFFALEFFFRGFLIHGLRHRMGWTSVLVMTVPYCMIHFGKPLPETLGAIIAGIALGSLSLWTRSIWGGVLLHIAVALTMDLLAIALR